MDKQKKGEHKGIRYISNICQDNVKLVKEFLDAGIRIRHVKNLPSMSFGVSDKETAATIEKMDGGRMIHSLLLSNKPAYIDHFHSIFEDLWAKGIDAEDRIREIEEGRDLTDIEIRSSNWIVSRGGQMIERILVVDDESDVCFVLEKVLGQSGFEVESYRDPLLALAKFKANSYDLVILDIRMPDLNGFALYREIRNLDKKVKICFLTAGEMYYGYSDIFFSVPASCFIRKPIDNEELLNRIKEIIAHDTM